MTNSARGFTKQPSSTTSTVPTKGRALAAKPSVTSDPAAKTAKQRAQAVDELDYLIDGDRKSFTTDQATANVAVPATNAKSSKVTALEVAQSQVADAKRTLKLLTSIATEKKSDADNKKGRVYISLL